jgi:hypothetical protein
MANAVVGGDGNFVGRKACESQYDLVPVLAHAFDVVARVIGLRLIFHEIEQPIETGGRPPEGRKSRYFIAISSFTLEQHDMRHVTGSFMAPAPRLSATAKISLSSMGFKRNTASKMRFSGRNKNDRWPSLMFAYFYFPRARRNFFSLNSSCATNACLAAQIVFFSLSPFLHS